jgi:hypothetical protein
MQLLTKPAAFLVVALMCLMGAPLSAAQQEPAPLGVESIVEKMESAMDANRARIPAHTVRREYKMFGDDGEGKSSRVTADVEYLPPVTRNYRILEGSGRAEGVVKKILESEREGARHQDVAEFSRKNYEFQLAGEGWLDGARHYILETTPLRKEKYLLRGRIWVDKQSFVVRRVVGSPAKSPSWWVKDVEITLEFRRVGDVWIQCATEAVANLRLFGRHYMKARDVDFKPHASVARKRGGGTPAGVIGAGVIR